MSPAARPSILIASADPALNASLDAALAGLFDCLTTTDGAGALGLLEEHFVQVVLCETGMTGRSGAPLTEEIRARWPETALLHLRREADSSSDLPAVTEGFDPASGLDHILTLPCPDDQLRSETATAVRLFQLRRENERLQLEVQYKSRARTGGRVHRTASDRSTGFDDILRVPGSAMNSVIEAARQIASFDLPALIQGAAGTGKRTLAQAMHENSLRSDKPFLALDCAGLSPDVIALELFGSRGNAGHQRMRMGLLQKADRGTLYLGAVETLGSDVQLALLRLLREGTLIPFGAQDSVSSRPRLICGCGGDLSDAVARGAFCSDLFYLLSAATISLPPLADRTVDIPAIAQEMLVQAADTHGKPVFGFADETLRYLCAYPWPGNLRELQAEILRMLIFSQTRTLGPELLSRHILQHAPTPEPDSRIEDVMQETALLKDRMEAIEARILRETLTRLKWNKSRAAAELGLSRVGLRAKLERYGVMKPQPQPQEG